MLMLISPAKSLDFESDFNISKSTKPVFRDKANQLIKELKKYSVEELQDLMDISYDLAQLNYDRFRLWQNDPEIPATKQALPAFTGEVFRGIDASSLSEEELAWSQEHLRILSGLYGILRPLDRIQPYRLEMGSKLKIDSKKNLYQFWGDKITKEIGKTPSAGDYIINLASNEYYKSVKPSQLQAKVITPVFKDFNKGELKVVTVYAKNARGQMVRYIIKNKINDPEKLKLFDVNGYAYDDKLSDEHRMVFVR
ncbi:MAG: peroxide stress protein YaaA [Bacteroidota bacterium]